MIGFLCEWRLSLNWRWRGIRWNSQLKKSHRMFSSSTMYSKFALLWCHRASITSTLCETKAQFSSLQSSRSSDSNLQMCSSTESKFQNVLMTLKLCTKQKTERKTKPYSSKSDLNSPSTESPPLPSFKRCSIRTSSSLKLSERSIKRKTKKHNSLKLRMFYSSTTWIS